MSAIDVQISLRCAACATIVPVNAFATEVTCWGCERRTPLRETTWQLLLEAPLREGPSLGANVERNATLRSEVGSFERVFRGGDPVCVGCRTPISADELRALALQASATKAAHCPQCNHVVLVRPAPEALAKLGVAAIVGESGDQLAGASAKRAPVPLACSSCGGSLQVDGAQRTVACPFCSTTQYLPDAVWISLRAMPVLQWTLVLTQAASVARANAPSLARWTTLIDAVSDPQGNLYCLGASAAPSDDEMRALLARMREGRAAGRSGALSRTIPAALWCMSRDGTLIWQRSGLSFGFQAQLAWAPSGHVLLREGPHAHVLQTSDGATVYRYGEDGPPLEIGPRASVTFDADETILAIDGDRLVRFEPRGAPVATWGTGPRKNVSDGEGEWVHEIRNKPLKVHEGIVATGFDGHVWIQSSISYDGFCHLASYERSGSRRFTARVPVAKSTLLEQRPAIDAQGAAYVLVRELGKSPSLFRVEPDGDQVRPFAHGVAQTTPSEKAKIAVAADGTVFVVGGHGQFRRFGPDGSVQHVSKESADLDRASP